MKRIVLLALLLIFSLVVMIPQAQEATPEVTEEPGPCASNETFNEEGGACAASLSLEMSVQTPQWLTQYPIADQIVELFVTQQRITFLTSMFELQPERPLYFELAYEDTFYGERLASLLFRINYDLGVESPVSEIYSFTFDLEVGAPIELAELMLPNANPVSTFGPLVPQEAVDEGFVSLISGGLDDPQLFENWVLTEEGLTFYYPAVSQDGIEAGELSVFLPMDVVAPVLILPEANLEATEETD